MVVLRIVTRCATVDKFIAAFQRLCTATTCFVPTADRRPVGIETAFAIQLADGTPVLGGLGVVLASHADADHEYRHPGLVLGIRSLDPASEIVFQQLTAGSLVERGAAAPLEIATGEQSGKVAATRAQLADMVRPTTQMAPIFDEITCACLDEDAAVPDMIEAGATVPTERPAMPTTLGVAPITPATVVRAPFVIDTPVRATRRPATNRDAIPVAIPESGPIVAPPPPRPRVTMLAIRDRSRGFWDAVRHAVRALRWKLRRRR